MQPHELKKLRETHGVSQTELADFLGYSVNGKPNRSMIARFENGYAKINTRLSKLINLYFDEKNGNV